MGVRAIFAFLLLAAPAWAQTSTDLPAGQTDPDALRKLASLLGESGGGDNQKIDPETMKLFEQFMKNPQFRDQMEKRIKEEVKKNPQLMEQLGKQNPELKKQIQREIPNLPDPSQKLNTKPPAPNTPTTTDPPKDPNNPFEPFPKNPNQKPDPTKNPEFQEMAKIVEKVTGPLDKNPAVKQALLDIFSDANKGNSKPGGTKKPFWADLDKGSGKSNTAGALKWLQGWNAPKMGTSNWFNGPKTPKVESDWKLPSGPKLPSFDIGLGGISVAGLGTVGTAVLIFAVVAVVGFLIWKFFPQFLGLPARTPKPLPGLGPWTIDPREIASRADLVKAFEYMSVLVCGDGARVWNHVTIAEALVTAVPESEPFAEPLAKLYALARYTPLSDAFTPEAIAEARGYLCRLAGVAA